MATTSQIRETAAEILGILGEGETLPSYEVGDLNQAIAEVHSTLRQLNLVTWASTDNVPDEYAASFAMLVADDRKTKYQIPDNRYMRIMAEGWGQNMDGQAIKMIKRLQAKQKLGVTQIENY
jgi:hypothetical protein